MIRLRRLSAVALLATVAACADDAPTAPSAEPAFAPELQALSVADESTLHSALAEARVRRGVLKVELSGDIELTEPLVYSSPLPLHIDGKGYTLTGPDVEIPTPVLPGERYGEPSGGDALVLFGGGDVHLEDLTITGAAGNGIYMELPAQARGRDLPPQARGPQLPGRASGTVRISFENVHITDNGLSGLWVEEQANAEGDIDSDAGIAVRFSESSVTGNGFAGDGEAFADFDGVRVNEGGDGNLYLFAEESTFDGNAAEGIELDETGSGMVRAEIESTTFDDNGLQPQFAGDPEDGFDIDEAGPGGVFVVMEDVSANDSYDEGIDLDEEGPGDVRLHFEDVTSMRSVDENIKVSEDANLEPDDDGFVDPSEVGGGSILFTFEGVVASDGNDDGIQLEEWGPGDIAGSIEDSQVTGNADDGLDIEQLGPGGGVIDIEDSDISGNADDDINAEGVTVNFDS